MSFMNTPNVEMILKHSGEYLRLIESLKAAFLKQQYVREDLYKIKEAYKLMGKDTSQFLADWSYKEMISEDDLEESILIAVNDYCDFYIQTYGDLMTERN